MAWSIRKIFLLSAVAGVIAAQSPVWADPPIQVGRVNLISGQVSFRPGSLDEWVPATLNYPLTAGDLLWADADARAEIHVGAAALRIDSDTELSFLNLDDETIQVRLSQGSLNIWLRALEPGDAYEVDTPNSSISLLSAGSYRIDVQNTGDTTLVVRQGESEVTVGQDAFNVAERQSATISGLDSFAYFLEDAPGLDDWDSWCAARDQREARAASARYVSRGMIGMEDLDEHGTWLVVAGYGPVWAPARVPVGWAPYRFGHWAWVEPWGWTWIDDASWGFAPFHYGRWAFINRGWVWVPGAIVSRPVYAPALVVFVGGNGWGPAAGDGIGWFPLGPREVYIPPYSVSPTYVQRINITHVTNITVQTIQRIDVTRTVYVNRNVPQAVTLMPRQDFVQSRSASRSAFSISSAELRRAPVMGMTAAVAPRRESVVAQPLMPRAGIARPPIEVTSRRVYSRRAPAAPQVPFAAREQALTAHPGRPLDQDALAALQRNRAGSQPQVTVVNPGSVSRVQNPPVFRGGERTVPPRGRTAPAPGAVMSPSSRNVPPAATTLSPPGRTAPSGDRDQREAASLIATLKTQSLPQADKHLAAARKAGGVRLDFNALTRQLAAARAALAGAERDLADGNAKLAMQKATSVQRQISQLENAISDAMKSGGPDSRERKVDDRQNQAPFKPRDR
jgi:hypothetical protein